jgi:uncharacterized protein (TIGR02117 family)
LKKLRKFGKFLLLGLLGFCLAALVGAFTPTKWFYSQQSDCTVSIYVSNVNNFHAEIILPVNNQVFDWRKQLDLNRLGKDADRYNYLSFGWGDKKFFMNSSFDPMTIFDVLFLPGSSVMHVWGHPEPKLQLDPDFELKQVNLSKAQYLKLAQFINDTFVRGASPVENRSADERTIYLKQGLYSNSGFYEAKGTYSALRTCNSWTAEALRVADVNTPLWPALASAVMNQIDCDCEQS